MAVPVSDLSPMSACDTPITIGLSHGGITQAAEASAEAAPDPAAEAVGCATDATGLGDADAEHPATTTMLATRPTRKRRTPGLTRDCLESTTKACLSSYRVLSEIDCT